MIVFRAQSFRFWIAVLAMTAGLGAGPVARAAAPDSFLLGTSTRTGDICEALADDNDMAVMRKGAHAWSVRCRGWNYDFGRLYAYTNGGGDLFREGGAWTTALAKRATCASAKPVKIAGLRDVTKRQCKTTRSGGNYVVYQARAFYPLQPGAIVTAEGLEQVSDLLETGLKIVAGRGPKAVAATESTGDEAEEVDPASLASSVLRMAYVDNQRWQFADAERGFRASALDERASRGARAEAYLNWALNASNSGRFKEADDRFQDAANLQASIDDKALNALALNYKAMHERNQLHFKEAIAFAQQAIDLRASIGKSAVRTPVKPGEIMIDEALATAFNHGAARGETLQTLTDAQKAAVRDAQAWYIIASAQESLGQRDQALASLARAERIFDDQAGAPGSDVLFTSTGWLRAQILAEGAQVDLSAGRGPEAVAAANAALEALRRQPELRGTATEAAFILTLAQAEATAKQTDAAMRDYGEGFKLFRDTRGSLGASADAAEVYFDLLIQQAKSDPAHAATYEGLYFEAMQSVVDATTADTMKRLFARISTGDSASAGLARSFEDTGRLLAVANGAVKTLQDQGKYSGADKDRADAQVAMLRAQQEKLQQQLLALNPHYNAIVRTAATIPSLQAVLKGDEIFVKFLILGDRSYGLAITKDRVVTYGIPLSADEAAQTVKRLRVAVDTIDRLPRFDVAGALCQVVRAGGRRGGQHPPPDLRTRRRADQLARRGPGHRPGQRRRLQAARGALSPGPGRRSLSEDRLARPQDGHLAGGVLRRLHPVAPGEPVQGRQGLPGLWRPDHPGRHRSPPVFPADRPRPGTLKGSLRTRAPGDGRGPATAERRRGGDPADRLGAEGQPRRSRARRGLHRQRGQDAQGSRPVSGGVLRHPRPPARRGRLPAGTGAGDLAGDRRFRRLAGGFRDLQSEDGRRPGRALGLRHRRRQQRFRQDRPGRLRRRPRWSRPGVHLCWGAQPDCFALADSGDIEPIDHDLRLQTRIGRPGGGLTNRPTSADGRQGLFAPILLGGVLAGRRRRKTVPRTLKAAPRGRAEFSPLMIRTIWNSESALSSEY
jgi:tetratricopeptide (TPR) repeat protein